MRFTWIQLIIVCTQAGLGAKRAGDIAQEYFRELEESETTRGMDKLCRELVMEYTTEIKALHKHNRCSQLVKDCCQYVKDNLREKISVGDVAEAMHFSESYITHKFREEMGMTIKEYLLLERVNEAQVMLAGQKGLSQISDELCFASQSHFTATFKKLTGRTPNQYRKELRQLAEA